MHYDPSRDRQSMDKSWLICEHCDAVYQRPVLRPHQKAHCVRCGAILMRHCRLDVEALFALSLTAAILLLLANTYPLLDISLQGAHSLTTLWGSVTALAQGPITLIALLMAVSIIVAPALQVGMLLWVLWFARGGRRAPGFILCMLWLERLRPWSMLEVCLLGVLVSVFKLVGMLDVAPGLGLLALTALSLLLTLLAGRHIRRLWEWLP